MKIIKVSLILTQIVLMIISFNLAKANSKDLISGEGPKIKIDSNFKDFGQVKQGTIVKQAFIVQNIGDEILVIKDVYTDCGCTTAKASVNTVKPQETSRITVTYDSTGKALGLDNKSIYIISNDANASKVELNIQALIVDVDIDSQTLTEPEMLTSIPTISSFELQSRLNKGEKFTILDVREENEYLERHIPGAIWFPKSKFDRNDKQVLAKLKKIDKDKVVVSYCGAGHRSSYVTKKLRERGYNAFNLDGISFWEKQGFPLIRGPKLPSSQEPSIVHLEEAYQHYFLLFKDIVWIDVRNKADYYKGHIKGALAIPLSDLEYNLQMIPKDKEIVFYCEGTWDGGKCDASMSAGRILIKNGFKQGKIKVFEDGFGAWEDAGYPIERGKENEKSN